MAYRFFEISKANEEINRLDSIVADRDKALTEAQSKISELEKKAESNAGGSSDVEAENAKLKTRISELEKDLAASKAETAAAKADLATAREDAVKAKTEADKQASIKAAEITAGQGQPPVELKPSETPAKSAKVDISNLTGLDRAIAAHRLLTSETK